MLSLKMKDRYQNEMSYCHVFHNFLYFPTMKKISSKERLYSFQRFCKSGNPGQINTNSAVSNWSCCAKKTSFLAVLDQAGTIRISQEIKLMAPPLTYFLIHYRKMSSKWAVGRRPLPIPFQKRTKIYHQKVQFILVRGWNDFHPFPINQNAFHSQQITRYSQI